MEAVKHLRKKLQQHPWTPHVPISCPPDPHKLDPFTKKKFDSYGPEGMHEDPGEPLSWNPDRCSYSSNSQCFREAVRA